MNIINNDGGGEAEWWKMNTRVCAAVVGAQCGIKEKEGSRYSNMKDKLLCLAWLGTSVDSFAVQSKGGDILDEGT